MRPGGGALLGGRVRVRGRGHRRLSVRRNHWCPRLRCSLGTRRPLRNPLRNLVHCGDLLRWRIRVIVCLSGLFLVRTSVLDACRLTPLDSEVLAPAQIFSLDYATRGASVRCLGTLVDARTMLTARHCVLAFHGSSRVCSAGYGREFSLHFLPGRDLAAVSAEPGTAISFNGSAVDTPICFECVRPQAALGVRRTSDLLVAVPLVKQELASPRDQIVHAQGDSPCKGDSGGPLFLDCGHGLALSGVLSRGGMRSHGVLVYERLDDTVIRWLQGMGAEVQGKN